MTLKFYLAGPDVFLPNAVEIGEKKKEILEQHGFIGVFPLDNEISPNDFKTKHDFGLHIAQSNEKLMNECNGIIANLTPWRGIEADSGTSFELGYMRAQKKIITAYSNDPHPFFHRIRDNFYNGDIIREDGLWRGKSDQLMIEDMDMPENLMLVNAAIDSTDIFHCAKETPENYYSSLKTFKETVSLLKDFLQIKGKNSRLA